ncbi:MAG TPA: efflux RND transporter periplasmic adaptor subunit [Candidatus Limnocylindrales bacterium]|nr:efflux RND transporter periplasmic adaptor subunit [Candidatus Limnocylindrales bacterium]
MKLRILAIVVLIVVGAGALFVTLRPPSASGQEGQLLSAVATRRNVAADAVATGNVTFSRVYGLTFGSAPSIVATATSAATSGGSSGGASSSADWTVTRIVVAVGAKVKKGEVLAVASAPDLTAQVSAAKNGLKADENHLTDADDQLDAATTTDADRAARTAIYQARAQVTTQKQAIAGLEAQLAAATLKAPVDGVVTAVNAVAGLPAPSGTALEIGASPLEVVGSYTESDLGSLAVGQPATVAVSAAGANVPGTVVAIAPTASSSGGSSSVVTYDVTIALTTAPAGVAPGMSADVSITTASASNVVAVPSVALSGGSNGYTVDVIGADGTVERRSVDVGLVTSAWAEIRSGLAEGDRVVTGRATARQSTTTTTGGFGGAVPGVGGLGGGGGRFGGGNARGGGQP